ncbi:MAG: TrkH family potassium uptake protein [Candidatus Altiarchaeia archaeon]
MLSFNTEDIRTALRDISGMFRTLAIVFLIPLPIAAYYVLVKDFYGGTFALDHTFNLLGGMSLPEMADLIMLVVSRSLVFLIPSFISYLVYSFLKNIPPQSSTKTKHVVISVSIIWLAISLIGALPYLLGGNLSPIDSFFESMSGWSTTGLTLMHDLDGTPRDILFYRSLTQWLGGLGIVFIALTIFVRKGSTAMVYYSSEKGDKRIKPSVRGTVIEIWKIYSVYTLLCMILLYVAGMGLFDALNHSFTSVSTGGFTTHDAGLAFFQDKPFIAPVAMLFMLVGSISFYVHFRLFELNPRSLLENIEFRYMAAMIVLATLTLTILIPLQDPAKALDAPLDAAFQCISAITTSGYSIADVSKWSEVSQMILILLMYVGGFYGSTAGGIKILRLIVIASVILYSLRKMMLPKTAILRLKIGSSPIDEEEVFNVLGFSMAYLGILILGALLLMSEFSTIQALFISASALGNVGLNNVPADKWLELSDASKLVITGLMWVGRLEVLPVLILIASLFTRRRGG